MMLLLERVFEKVLGLRQTTEYLVAYAMLISREQRPFMPVPNNILDSVKMHSSLGWKIVVYDELRPINCDRSW